MPLNLDSVIRVSATSLPTGVSTERFGKALLLSVPFEVGPTTNVFNGANQTAAETALSTYAGTSANAGWLATLDADSSLYVTLTWPTSPTDSLRQHRVGSAFVDLPTISQTATNAKYRRFQRYATMEEVANVYDPSDEVYKAASVYFSSSPYPQELFVGLWDAGGSETIQAALDAIAAINNDWKFLSVDNRIREASISDVSETEVVAASTWAGSNNKLAIIDCGGATALTAADTTSLAYQLRNQARTAAIYSSNGYAGIAYSADWSAVNFSGSNTLISGKFTILEGVQAVDLTSAQKAALDDKETNAYYNVGGVPIVGEGTLGTNGWIDVQYWLDWVVEEVQRQVLSFLRSSPRVPQTSKGLASLKRVIEGVCEQGRRNGGIAPGTLSEALVADVKSATGNDGFDGFLPQGYLVYVPPITTLSQTARDARQAPPFDVWFKGSGAINSVDIAMTFQN